MKRGDEFGKGVCKLPKGKCHSGSACPCDLLHSLCVFVLVCVEGDAGRGWGGLEL